MKSVGQALPSNARAAREVTHTAAPEPGRALLSHHTLKLSFSGFLFITDLPGLCLDHAGPAAAPCTFLPPPAAAVANRSGHSSPMQDVAPFFLADELCLVVWL